MCGITGLYTFQPRPDRMQIHGIAQDMTRAIANRGPDCGDVWQDPDAPLALGHRRLSIIDLSDAGKQPMESHSSRYMIVFNGEIYNFKEVRAKFEKDYSEKFNGESDTEVLLAAIEHWGLEKTLDEIKGMFAFALWDRKKKALFFARDRFGKKPLYIGWAGSTLVFGSELKAFCAHPDFRRDINRAALTSYMRFGYVPAPLCIYDQVWQLLPGNMMALDLEMLRAGQDLLPLMEYFWNPKDALNLARQNPVTDNEDKIVQDFEEILQHSVSERMISDVPLGAFLSGGIDSSTIVSLMQKTSDIPIKTYSIGFNESGYNEAQHAKEIAQHLKIDHHEIYLEPSTARDVVAHLPEIYDEPFADTSAIPTYLIAKFARESVTVALSGDGGDEMLGGYNRHITGPKAWKTIKAIPPNLHKPFAQIIRSIPPHVLDRLRPNRPQFGAHMHKFSNIMEKVSDIERAMIVDRPDQPDEIFEASIYLSLVSNFQKPMRFVQDGEERNIPLVDNDMQADGLGFAENMMYWDTISYLNGDILTKVDRASMAVGLEARAPLLDQRLYEYVWRLPEEMKIRDGKGKWLLREVLKRHVPEDLFNRPKQGFSVPIAEWLRGELKEWADDLLNEKDLKEQGLLDYIEVRRLWTEHQKGKGSHANKLWTVLMFQAWYKHWVKQ